MLWTPIFLSDCGTPAMFSCRAEYVFESGTLAPGPEDASRFETQPDGTCGARAVIRVPGTDVEINVSVASGSPRRFTVRTSQKGSSREEPFQKNGDDALNANVVMENPPEIVFGGEKQRLKSLDLECGVVE